MYIDQKNSQIQREGDSDVAGGAVTVERRRDPSESMIGLKTSKIPS